MSKTHNAKMEFLSEFQKAVIQGRRLLQTGNHRWADRLLTDIYFEIEKNENLDEQKKHQLIMIIANSWWIYINSLTHRVDEEIHVDTIRYIDAYKRFFSFLAKLEDFYLFNNFATNLLKIFIEMDDLSQTGITKYINSFCVKVSEKKEHLKLIELQLLLMFLRKSVIPTEFFHYSMEILGKTVFEIEPSKRALFLYIFLENVNIKYNLLEDSEEFVRELNKILLNRVPGYLKNEFGNLTRITVNERNFKTIVGDLEELIDYLNNIGESKWIVSIIRNLFAKVQHFESFGDAVTYIRKFIDFAIQRNRFEIAFEIYDFLEDLFMYQTDLGYDNILIELWVEACKKFIEMKEKKFLLQSIEKLNNHLKMPQTTPQLFHYFYTSNFLWQFKSMFFSLEERDFWRMMFYRTLYEENDFELAVKILPFLDKKLRTMINDPSALYNETQILKRDIYSFGDEELIPLSALENFAIKQFIMRINSKSIISFRVISREEKIIEGTISNEFWNDIHLLEIFNDIFSEHEEKRYEFSLMDYGKILFNFLPNSIRELFKRCKIESLQTTPEIYFVLDRMTIPFELIYDNNYFLLKYSYGYIIGEPQIKGINFDHLEPIAGLEDEQLKFNVLIIDSINASTPIKWNENLKRNELVYPFPSGLNEINFITDFFGNRAEINQMTILSGLESTKETIMTHLSLGANHIIQFVGNIFYSKWSPKKSYFLTNDRNILTLDEINKAIKENSYNLSPLIFFNTQIFDVKGNKLTRVLTTLGEITEQFDFDYIAGIVSRNYPIFNEETKEISANFYDNLFKKNSLGMALLKARQSCMANKMTQLVEQEFDALSPEEGIKHINAENSLAISSYVLFGKPWKRLS